MFQEKQGRTSENGQVLLEIEPIRYELNSVELNVKKQQVYKSEREEIGTTVIKNTGTRQEVFAEAYSHAYTYTCYWGQGNAIIRAHNISIKLPGGRRLPDISWGIEYKEQRVELLP